MAEGKSASAILVKNPAPPPKSRKGRVGKGKSKCHVWLHINTSKNKECNEKQERKPTAIF